jgi:hypothetical protein
MDNKPSAMKQARIDLLNDLGFAWCATEETWYQQLNNFKSFREQYGHSNVPVQVTDTKYRKLYLWIQSQRHSYVLMKQGKISPLTPKRVEELDNIGFCWDPLEARWSLHFQELTDLHDKHRHCVIPAKNSKLRKWAYKQRYAYNKSQWGKGLGMTKERVRALDSIGFDWTPVVSHLRGPR